MEDNSTIAGTVQKDHKCNTCAAVLEFKPGTTSLVCIYCGAQNEIAASDEKIEEEDFHEFLSKLQSSSEQVTLNLVKCDACGAETTFNDKIVSDNCVFCGNQITIKSGSTSSILKPKSLLPFKIDQKQSFGEFQKWVKSLWFAPNDLKKKANSPEKFVGIYIPYWTYDSGTNSTYTGQRGVNYTTTETYTTTENGRSVTRTRVVTKIRWSPAHGVVKHDFDDVLVLASDTLPKDYTEKLEPWDLENINSFDEKFLSGFKAESYKVGLPEGFDRAKIKMDVVIRDLVRKDIGGDHQQIATLNTRYSNIKFKHLLLPIWLSTFAYNKKVYRFLVNGRTGEVQGERPYSGMKIFLFILMILVILGGIVALIIYFKNK